MQNQIHIEEYKALRAEIAIRMKMLHQLIALGSIFWIIFVIFGFWIYQTGVDAFYTYLLIIPLIFSGLIFNYQDNQRAMESTARYINDVLWPKISDSQGWEKYFGSQKKIGQLSNGNKLFALLIPLLIPIAVLVIGDLSNLQTTLAIVDIAVLLALITNFRYKLYRVK